MSEEITWQRREGQNVRVGLTKSFVTAEPIAFVELLPQGSSVDEGGALGLFQRQRGREFELTSPLAGKIVEINRAVHVVDDPVPINRDPEGAGWLVLIDPTA